MTAAPRLDRAGLRGVDRILTALTPDPEALAAAVDEAEALLVRPAA